MDFYLGANIASLLNMGEYIIWISILGAIIASLLNMGEYITPISILGAIIARGLSSKNVSKYIRSFLWADDITTT